MRLGLPEEEAELGGPMEASSVGHREDEDAHVALQRGQVLRYKHVNKTRRQRWISARRDGLSDGGCGVKCQTAAVYKIPYDCAQRDTSVVMKLLFSQPT